MQGKSTVLERLYPDNVVTLKDYIIRITRDCDSAQALAASLVRVGDHTDYGLELLCRTLVCPSVTAPPLARNLTLSQNNSQHEVRARLCPQSMRCQEGRDSSPPPTPPLALKRQVGSSDGSQFDVVSSSLVPLLLRQVLLRVLDSMVRVNADNVLRYGFRKVRQLGQQALQDARVLALGTHFSHCCHCRQRP